MARRALLIGTVLATGALTPVSLAAQPEQVPPRAAVLATVGAMRPLEAGVRELYDGIFVPVTIEADVRVAWKVFVFGGVQFYRKDGEVVFTQPPAPEERFPLRLSATSVRAGGGVAHPWRRWLLSAAGGLSFSRYNEQWTTGEVPAATGHALGFIAGGGIDCRIVKPVWAVGRVEYAYTPLDETRETVPTFDLTGVSASVGVAIRF